jgi:hypothetical protein
LRDSLRAPLPFLAAELEPDLYAEPAREFAPAALWLPFLPFECPFEPFGLCVCPFVAPVLALTVWAGFAGWLPFPLPLKLAGRTGREGLAAPRELLPLAAVRGIGARRRSPLAPVRASPEPMAVRLRSRGWAAPAVLAGRGRGEADFPGAWGLTEAWGLPECAAAGRILGSAIAAEKDSEINSSLDSSAFLVTFVDPEGSARWF